MAKSRKKAKTTKASKTKVSKAIIKPAKTSKVSKTKTPKAAKTTAKAASKTTAKSVSKTAPKSASKAATKSAGKVAKAASKRSATAATKAPRTPKAAAPGTKKASVKKTAAKKAGGTIAKASSKKAAKKKVAPIPAGCEGVLVSLPVENAMKAIEFYKNAFGAKQKTCIMTPHDTVMHAELDLSGHRFYVADPMPGSPAVAPTQADGKLTHGLVIYAKDTDALYQRALDEGATSVMAPESVFWGDRWATVKDPFGHVWSIATRLENFTPKRLQKMSDDWFAEMARKAEEGSAPAIEPETMDESDDESSAIDESDDMAMSSSMSSDESDDESDEPSEDSSDDDDDDDQD